MSAPEARSLLARLTPILRYDSLEGYFADSAEEWTASPHNRLVRKDGGVVAAGQGLSLATLAPVYADHATASAGDVVESTSDEYSRDYALLRGAHQELRNVVYGRVAPDKDGVWLQYWFFYFLNDYQLAWGIDVHEGDWEMIQLLVRHGAEKPEQACYAQHDVSEVRDWGDVATEDGRPLVYVGRGSHASFFEPGYHQTDFYDLTDGKQVTRTPQRLVDVTEPPPWLLWPGHWGGDRTGYAGPSSPSAHAQWARPDRLLTVARTHAVRRPPGSPRLAALRRNGRVAIDFDATGCPQPLRRLIATVNCLDEPTPPHPFRFALSQVEAGTLVTTIAADADKRYEIRVAAVLGAADPSKTTPTAAEIFVFEPPNLLLTLRRKVTGFFARLVHAWRDAAGSEYADRRDTLLR